ncbi:hypothetical protein DDT91_15445 [Algoriphagus sp. AK58]|nr:hypothetical protein [Algoriphagus sp. AK58]
MRLNWVVGSFYSSIKKYKRIRLRKMPLKPHRTPTRAKTTWKSIDFLKYFFSHFQKKIPDKIVSGIN